MKRRKYVKPSITELQLPTARAQTEGYCLPGTTADNACAIGSGDASDSCLPGGTAADNCVTGPSAANVTNCLAGSTAVG